MDYSKVTDFLTHNDKFIITAHETPDGDAIGSEYALLRALKKLGKKVFVINADPLPNNFRFLDVDNDIKTLKSPEILPPDLEEYVLVIVDVNDILNIGNVAELILPRVRDYLIIDHHEFDSDKEKHNFIQKDASSTCEILFPILEKMGVAIDLDIAQALYAGIIYDTGSFIYPKTSSTTFGIAHQLVCLGVKPNLVYSNVYECRSIAFLVLQSKVLGTLELVCGQHIAIQTMSKKLLAESGADYDEGQQLINTPLAAENVKVSIFFKENSQGLLRCSLRSKDEIDVAEIAKIFKGGGHKTAAGFKYYKPLATVKQKVLKLLKSKYFPEVKDETC